jgi:beta-lactam-binding protein with PASTA domain
VPLVVGMTKAGAEATLHAQPLGASIAYAPAKAGRLPGIVVSQDPRSGGLSAARLGDDLGLQGRARNAPNFVGSSITDAQREAARLKIKLRAKTAPGRAGAVLRQSREPGVAVARGLRVTLVVGDGSRT